MTSWITRPEESTEETQMAIPGIGSKKRTYYFAYGANLNLDGMRFRCPGYKPMGMAYVEDHQLYFRGVASITPVEGKRVYGALYLLTSEHFEALDRFEGYPHLYDRVKMTVTTEYGATVEAIVYVMNLGTYRIGAPSEWYLKTILEGGSQWELPPEYLKEIHETATKRDGWPDKINGWLKVS